MPNTQRKLVFILLTFASLLPTFGLLNDVLRVAHSSDTELIARFTGAAPEDVLGFGFWPSWILLATIQSIILVAAWLVLGQHWLRYFIPALLCAFAAVSVFDYNSFTREYALWSTYHLTTP